MSTNLYWRPITTGQCLTKALKFVFQRRLGAMCTRLTLGDSDREYVQALVDSEIEGAQDLYDALEKFGEIELYFE